MMMTVKWDEWEDMPGRSRRRSAPFSPTCNLEVCRVTNAWEWTLDVSRHAKTKKEAKAIAERVALAVEEALKDD